MALTTDVNLPRKATPVFPDRCVRCDEPSPGSTWRCKQRTVSALSWLTFWMGKAHIVHVPCCKECGRKLSLRGTLETAGLFLVVALLVFFFGDWFEGIDRSVRRPAMIAIFVATIVPYVAFAIFNPPAFDTYVRRGDVDYEFGDADYAAEFMELNAGATSDDLDG